MAAMPGPACCTELGHSTHLLCGSSPCQRQPFCASPRLCPSQPPEVLALSVPTGARAWYRTCLPPPTPAPACTVLCCVSVSCCHTCQAALTRPQLGPGALARRPEGGPCRLRAPAPRPQPLVLFACTDSVLGLPPSVPGPGPAGGSLAQVGNLCSRRSPGVLPAPAHGFFLGVVHTWLP